MDEADWAITEADWQSLEQCAAEYWHREEQEPEYQTAETLQ